MTTWLRVTPTSRLTSPSQERPLVLVGIRDQRDVLPATACSRGIAQPLGGDKNKKNQVWCPFRKKDIEIIENVQRRATRQILSLKGMSYVERLAKLDVPTLACRRIRDMIERYKILIGIYDGDVCGDLFSMSRDAGTRGHCKKLYKRRSRLNNRKYTFRNRVVNTWNALPTEVVKAVSVKSFEKKLNKFWKGQSLKYDYKAVIEINSHVQCPNQGIVSLELESQA